MIELSYPDLLKQLDFENYFHIVAIQQNTNNNNNNNSSTDSNSSSSSSSSTKGDVLCLVALKSRVSLDFVSIELMKEKASRVVGLQGQRLRVLDGGPL